eukprot:TRINITY_DN2088_c1_g1_i1.p1 TRINITY_DN2088_c1_g1~~TRINITY_DN2088_c1_g1_i1.p1  ORF type:complete len:513 (-),score=139.71 TRINITY_DN2088_c1_g1_i1:51-1589(-)
MNNYVNVDRIWKNIVYGSLIYLAGSLIKKYSLKKQTIINKFDDQIGGHKWSEGRIGMMKIEDEKKVLKPLHSKQRGLIESNFYEEVRGDTEIQQFIPRYHGLITLNEPIKCKYMVLDDLTSGMKKPSILDLKLGQITYNCKATEYIKDRKSSKCPYQYEIGFRCCGMKSWNKEKKKYEIKDRLWGRELDEKKTSEKIFKVFFGEGSAKEKQGESFKGEGKKIRRKIVKACLIKIEKFIEWFQKQTKYLIFSASLLIVFDSEMNEEELSDSEISEKINIKLIDFSHVYPNNPSNSSNYLQFLNSYNPKSLLNFLYLFDHFNKNEKSPNNNNNNNNSHLNNNSTNNNDTNVNNNVNNNVNIVQKDVKSVKNVCNVLNEVGTEVSNDLGEVDSANVSNENLADELEGSCCLNCSGLHVDESNLEVNSSESSEEELNLASCSSPTSCNSPLLNGKKNGVSKNKLHLRLSGDLNGFTNQVDSNVLKSLDVNDLDLTVDRNMLFAFRKVKHHLELLLK